MRMFFQYNQRMRVLLMFLSMTLITKCSAENLLDPQELSQQLTNLAIEGLGTDNLQVRMKRLITTDSRSTSAIHSRLLFGSREGQK